MKKSNLNLIALFTILTGSTSAFAGGFYCRENTAASPLFLSVLVDDATGQIESYGDLTYSNGASVRREFEVEQAQSRNLTLKVSMLGEGYRVHVLCCSKVRK